MTGRMTKAEERLATINRAANRTVNALRQDLNQDNALEYAHELLVVLEAVGVYAVLPDEEPESFRVFNGLRIVK